MSQTIYQQAKALLRPADIDKGYYPKQELAQLLQQQPSLLRHWIENGANLDDSMIEAMTALSKVASVCGTSAFLLWCHQACALYLAKSEVANFDERLRTHISGETLGGTALSNPLKSWTGQEKLRLQAQKDGDGYLISGVLPWVSHIDEGQYCGAVAHINDGMDNSLFFLLEFDPRRTGWQLADCPAFAGLEGSSTYKITLNNYKVHTRDIISYNAQAFAFGVRNRFILLQSAMALGVAKGAIESILGDKRIGLNAYLPDGEQLSHAYDTLWQNLVRAVHADDLALVLDTRIQAALLAQKSAYTAFLYQGAKGYMLHACAQRHLKEAQFCAIVTPSLKHLAKLRASISPDAPALVLP